MNELRWILLVAGLLLLVAIYMWGARSRRRGTEAPKVETRPPVFTGGATGFERAAACDSSGGARDDDEMERRLSVPAAARRIEPSLTLGETDDDAGNFAREREDVPSMIAASRREPTLNLRDEPASTTRPGHVASPARPAARPAEPVRAPAPSGRSHIAESPAATSAAAAEPVTAPAAKPSRAAQKIVAVRVSAGAGANFDGGALMDALYGQGLQFGRYEIFHRLHDGRPVISAASLREPGSFDVNAMPSTNYPGVALFAVLPGPVPAADAFDELLYVARSLASQLDGALADERGAPLTAHRVMRMREEALEFGRTAGSA
jgi:cell division protein ZipA